MIGLGFNRVGEYMKETRIMIGLGLIERGNI